VRNQAEKSADQLDAVKVKLDTKAAIIVREQEQVIEAANKGIDRLNSDMDALRKRLDQKKEGPYDEVYHDLKDRYVNKLGERDSLQKARIMAEESISAAKLNVIPGEFDRSEY